jgi:hypothetical protein
VPSRTSNALAAGADRGALERTRGAAADAALRDAADHSKTVRQKYFINLGDSKTD